MYDLVKRDAIARHRARRAVLNNLSAELYPGDAHGFIGPIKPPSESVRTGTSPDTAWFRDHLVSTSYAWGRHDAGERRNANDIYRFGEAWADANWEFKLGYRSNLPALMGAYEKFFAGEAI